MPHVALPGTTLIWLLWTLATRMKTTEGLDSTRHCTSSRSWASFLERSTALVFCVAAAAVAAGAHPPPGAISQSLLVLAAIWSASVVHGRWPLTAEYSRWKYVPRLWSTALFLHPNVVLTLLWSVILFALGVSGAAAAAGWIPRRAADVLGLAACVGGTVFTHRHERGSRDRRIEDLDGSLARLQIGARLVVAATAGALMVLGLRRPMSPGTLVAAATGLLVALWPPARVPARSP